MKNKYLTLNTKCLKCARAVTLNLWLVANFSIPDSVSPCSPKCCNNSRRGKSQSFPSTFVYCQTFLYWLVDIWRNHSFDLWGSQTPCVANTSSPPCHLRGLPAAQIPPNRSKPKGPTFIFTKAMNHQIRIMRIAETSLGQVLTWRHSKILQNNFTLEIRKMWKSTGWFYIFYTRFRSSGPF